MNINIINRTTKIEIEIQSRLKQETVSNLFSFKFFFTPYLLIHTMPQINELENSITVQTLIKH